MANPSGIADPNNPGFDTNGFRMGAQTTFNNTSSNGTSLNIDPYGRLFNASGQAQLDSTGKPIQYGNVSGTYNAQTAPGGGLINPFTEAAPNYIAPPTFAAPTSAQALAEDPSYQFRFGQGQQALENSAAAGGTLLSGNTLKGLINYGQNAASQEYGNAYNRALETYGVGAQAAGAQNTFNWGKYLQDYNAYRNRYLDTASINNSTTA